MPPSAINLYTASVRRLIINADDFGLTVGVNRAIMEAHQRGLVSSATIMANANAVDDAVQKARQTVSISVGCHVVLIDGMPMLPPHRIRTLVTADGRAHFLDGWVRFASRVLRKHANEEQVAAEATAQIQKLQSAGLQLTHLDSHKHVHLLPAVLRPVLQAAKACGIRAVRNPFSPVRPLAAAHLLRRPRLWTRYSEVRLLRRFHDDFRANVAAAGMVTTDGTVGIVATGVLDHDLFTAIVGSLPDGTWEFVCHPGYYDEELRGVRTRLRESRVQELNILTSASARRAIETAGIELISFRDLIASSAVA